MKESEFYYDKELNNYPLLNKIDPDTAKEVIEIMGKYVKFKNKLDLNHKEKKILLNLVCYDAQNKTNKGLEVTNEMYNLRYKLRDSF